MSECSDNHIRVQWNNPLARCPVCDMKEDLDRMAKELEALRAYRAADQDLELRKGFSHASE